MSMDVQDRAGGTSTRLHTDDTKGVLRLLLWWHDEHATDGIILSEVIRLAREQIGRTSHPVTSALMERLIRNVLNAHDDWKRACDSGGRCDVHEWAWHCADVVTNAIGLLRKTLADIPSAGYGA